MITSALLDRHVARMMATEAEPKNRAFTVGAAHLARALASPPPPPPPQARAAAPAPPTDGDPLADSPASSPRGTLFTDDVALAAELLNVQKIIVEPTQLALYRYSQAHAKGEEPTLSVYQVGAAMNDGTFLYSVHEGGYLVLQLANPTAVLRDAITASKLHLNALEIPDEIGIYNPSTIDVWLPEFIAESDGPAGLVSLINSLAGTATGSNFSLEDANSLIQNFGNVLTSGNFYADDLLEAVDAGALLVLADPITGKLTMTTETSAEPIRAEWVVRHLSIDGTPAPGADLESVLALDLSARQVDNVLSLDAQAVRTAMMRGGTLAEIVNLDARSLTVFTDLDAGYVQWMRNLGTTPSISDIVRLSPLERGTLWATYQKAYWGGNPRGFRLAGPDETFTDIQPDSIANPVNLNGWITTFETDSGQKIIVTQQGNPALFDQVMALVGPRDQGKIDELREQNGIPEESGSVLNMPTSTLVNPDDPGQGYMTVGEAAVNNLITQYRTGVESGTIPHDDLRAQLLRALEARSAVQNGYSLLPYAERPTTLNTTDRFYPGYPDDNNPTVVEMSDLDVRELLDADAVNARVNELMADPAIQADYQASLNQAVASVGGAEMATNLYNAMVSEGYTDTIQSLKDQGLGYQAEQMIQRDLADLAVLDPAKAVEAAQMLRINALSVDMQKLMDDPSLIDDSIFEVAALDSIAIAIQTFRSGASVVRHGTQTSADLIKYLEGFVGDKKSVTALSNVIKQLTIDAKNTGGVGSLGNITQAQFDEAMAKTYVPLELRGKVSGFFGTTQKFGVWGSIGGGLALASFGYKVNQGAWSADSTPLERWGAARDIISFLSVVGHVSKFGAGLADYMRGNHGSVALGTDLTAQGTGQAWRALGLDLTLPEVYGRTSFLPNGMNYEELWTHYNNPRAFPTSHLNPQQSQVLLQASDNLALIWSRKLPTVGLATAGARVGVTVLKVLGTVTDLAGIADIVMGAISLKNAMDNNDTGGIVGSSLQIVGGTALTAAGLIGTASLFATVPAVVAASVAPLFTVGAVFAFAGFLAITIADSVQRNRALQSSTEDQNQWFRDLANDGLADPEWANKLEYYHYAWTIYGNDNTNTANESYIDFQRAEWEHFRDEPMSNSTSLWRLSGPDHRYTDLTTGHPLMSTEEWVSIA